jgi:HSP20 family protein
MENLFDGFLRRPSQLTSSGVYPLINLTGDKDNYYLRAEIPGLKSDELDIQVTSNTITLSGERKIPAEDKNAQYHRREREAGTFSRGISLPGDVDPDKVEASLKDGMLTVIIPKAEAAKPKQITVK